MYEIIVGGRGTVYYGTSRREAKKQFARFKQRAMSLSQRVSVVAFRNGNVVKEHDNALVMECAAHIQELVS